MPHPLARLAIGSLALIASTTACAVDGCGSGSARWFRCDGAYVARICGYGAHVLTTSGDQAFILGASRRTYVFADPAAEVALDRTDLGRLFSRSRVEVTECRASELPSLGEPVAIFSDDRGLSLRVNACSPGLTLGLRRASSVRLDSRSNAVFRVDYDSDRPHEIDVLYRSFQP